MKYSTVLLAVGCLAASVYAQCPDNNCPPPTFPTVPCGVPDCSIPANRYRPEALFPHADPNYYWQCAPKEGGIWGAVARRCACGTVFNPFLPIPRCSFYTEEGWRTICTWTNPPNLLACDPWCPDCNGGGDQAPPPVTTPAPDDDNNNNCPCCPPCIWWPCQPCLNTCACASANRRG